MELLGSKARKFIAIDNSERMLQKARQKVEYLGWDHVEFRLADAHQQPLEAEEVDLITIIQVLHHAEDPAKMIRSLVPGLKTGGMIIISDFLHHQEVWLKNELHHRWMGFKRLTLKSWLEDAGLETIAFEVMPGRSFETPEDTKLRLPDGFTIVGKKIS